MTRLLLASLGALLSEALYWALLLFVPDFAWGIATGDPGRVGRRASALGRALFACVALPCLFAVASLRKRKTNLFGRRW